MEDDSVRFIEARTQRFNERVRPAAFGRFYEGFFQPIGPLPAGTIPRSMNELVLDASLAKYQRIGDNLENRVAIPPTRGDRP